MQDHINSPKFVLSYFISPLLIMVTSFIASISKFNLILETRFWQNLIDNYDNKFWFLIFGLYDMEFKLLFLKFFIMHTKLMKV